MGKRPVLWLSHDQAPGSQEVNFSHKHKRFCTFKQDAQLFVHMKPINRQNNKDKHVTVTTQQLLMVCTHCEYPAKPSTLSSKLRHSFRGLVRSMLVSKNNYQMQHTQKNLYCG